nr:nonstructural polyprotein [Hepelivirales sp.]
MFKAITATHLPSEKQDAFHELRAGVFNRIHENTVFNAFRHHYLVTDRQAEHLSRLFEPMLVFADDSVGARYNTSSHPVAAVLNEYCNWHAKTCVGADRKKGFITMSIGDNYNSKVLAHHNCLLVENAVDAMRLGNALRSPDDPARRYLDTGDDSGLCVHGCAKCSFNANVAYAIHSLYDVGPDELVEMFNNHNIDKLVVYMFLPACLYDQDLHSIDAEVFHTHRSGNDLVFSFSDYSRPYVHSEKNWQFWANFSAIDGHDFRLLRETVQSIGPLHIITVVRTSVFPGHVPRTVPLGYITEGYYKVPSIHHALATSFTAYQSELRHHVVPAHVVDNALMYAERQANESYIFTEFITMLSGYTRRLKIGDVVYYDAWRPTADDMHEIAVSLFVIGASLRRDRTQCISAAFDHIKRFSQPGFMSELYYEFRTHLYRLFGSVGKPSKGVIDDTHRLWQLHVVRLRDRTFHSTYKVNSWRRGITPLPAPLPPATSSVKVDGHRGSPSDVVDSVSWPVAEPDQELTRSLRRASCGASDSHATSSATLCGPSDGASTTNESRVDRAPPSLEQSCASTQPGTTDTGTAATETTISTGTVAAGSTNSAPLDITYDHIDSGNADSDSNTSVRITRMVDGNAETYHIPRYFLPGHCAMQAFWAALPLNRRPSQRAILTAALAGLLNAIDSSTAYSYIFDGKWEGSDASTRAIAILAERFRVAVTIHTSTEPVLLNQACASNVSIAIQHTNNHFTVFNGGAPASAKFERILTLAAPVFEQQGPASRFVECSAAPGNLISMVADQYPESQCIAMIYTGALALRWDDKYDRPNIRKLFYRDMKSFNFQFARLCEEPIDVVICDAACRTNTEELSAEFVKAFSKNGKMITNLVMKTFGNPRYLWEFAAREFQSYRVMSRDQSSEEYYIFWGMGGPFPDGFSSISGDQDEAIAAFQESHFKTVTDHVAVVDADLVRKYRQSFVRPPFDSFPVPEVPPGIKTVRFPFKALTGYASAYKTTRAYELFHDYIFVAPSADLSHDHAKHGVAAYTQHRVFRSERPAGVLVDECQTFPMEYYALLALRFPDTPIVMMGDVYQTTMVDAPYTHVIDAGVTNNLHDVYQVPQDICKLINQRFGHCIRSLSRVTDGLRVAALDKLHKVKIIAFNVDSVNYLKSQGFDASTIATYTGRREDVVAFYIDSKAVSAGLTARPREIYTALTRARQQLILTGDSERVLRQYFQIHGLPLRQYEEISGLTLVNDTLEPAPIELVLKSEHSLAEDAPTSVKLAADVLRDQIKPVNPAYGDHIFIQPTDIASDVAGRATAAPETLIHMQAEYRGKRLQDEPFAKNQVSDNSKATAQTIFKRYLKRNPRMNRRQIQAGLSDLKVGFSLAMTGNRHSYEKIKKQLLATPEELSAGYRGYLESLNEKIKHNPSALDEANAVFDEFDMAINFFNKRQAKHFTKDGDDASAKVGQGISAMPKNVMLLLGAYFRVLLDKIRAMLKASGRKIILATHGSDAEINQEYLEMLASLNAELLKAADNDWAEFDSTIRMVAILLMCDLLLGVGAPAPLVNWYKQFRKAWTMLARTANGTIKIEGSEKQLSGGPGTICENTIISMCLSFTFFNYQNFQFAMFKGDDSHIRCRNAAFRADAKGKLTNWGMEAKLHTSDTGEFAGFFMTKYGMFPDVVRYTAKVLSKVYRDRSHFNEAMTSIMSRVSTVETEQQLHAGCLAATEHYQNLSAQQVRTLFNFLRYSRNITYESLHDVCLPILS